MLMSEEPDFIHLATEGRLVWSDRDSATLGDTSSAAGKAFLSMLGVFAEFETNLRRERQMEGIQAAKARGVYKGRPRSIDALEIRRLLSEGLGPSAVAKRLRIVRASVYRYASLSS